MILRFISYTVSADPFIGKIDKSTLSQQTLMEIIISNIENKEMICASVDNPSKIFSWVGVTVNTDGDVRDIHWRIISLRGSIDLQWLPSTVQEVRMSCRNITGTLDLASIPNGVKRLELNPIKLFGEVDLESLPEESVNVTLSGTDLTGSIDLKHLPKNLKKLYLNGNKFTGSVCLTTLPAELETLSLASNKLSGVVDLSTLPKGMKNIFLNENDFEGEVDFKKLCNFHYVNVSCTRISGELHAFFGIFISVHKSNVKDVRE